jgi:hypothetical protein
LFQLVRRKNRTVHQELRNNTWTRVLRDKITTATHIEEFVSLWLRIQNVQLFPGVRDSIIWKWTADGYYSTRSAYRIQFNGSYGTFHNKHIWKAHVENKCKVFTWILVKEKILTVDNLQKRGWTHQEHCVLCDGPLETGLHLSLLCPFAKTVWTQVLSWEHFDAQQIHSQSAPTHIATLWEAAARKVTRDEKRRFNRMVIYTLWNI